MNKLVSLLPVVLLTGCASVVEQLEYYQQEPENTDVLQVHQPATTEGSLHFHVEKLARQLFDTTNAFDVTLPVVIGTFLPSSSLSAQDPNVNMAYGVQIQESLTTFVTQAGLNVVEFKALPSVKVTSAADVMLSRSVNELDPAVKADYMITGSYTQQEQSLMVNVRMIRVFDKTIVAAATDYLPLNSMWSHSKVQLKQNQLYRSEY